MSERYDETKLEALGFTSEEIKRIRQVAVGDNNNKKGHFYEQIFGGYLLLRQTKENRDNEIDPLSDACVISNCETAVIDDWTFISSDGQTRHNYQLKNSATTGKIKTAILDRLELQIKLDTKFHNAQSSLNTLVCSDSDSVEENRRIIEQDGIQNVFCAFFPHGENLATILDVFPPLRECLSDVCINSNNYDAAIRYIFAAALGEQSTRISVSDWWKRVIELARPNIFNFEKSARLPEKVKDKLETLGFAVSESGSLSYNGFTVLLTQNLIEYLSRESAELETAQNAKEVIHLLIEHSKV